MSLLWIFLASLCLVAVEGCSPSEKRKEAMTQTEIEAKLNGVLQRMVSQCKDQQEIEQLKTAQIFHNVKGLPMDIVGLSVPTGTNKTHISFTLEHFAKTPPEVLATEAIEDLHLAKAIKPKVPNG
jgi:hypothetical protein